MAEANQPRVGTQYSLPLKVPHGSPGTQRRRCPQELHGGRMQRMAGSKFFGAEAVGEAKYEVSHVIGKGSYGTVCAARNKHTGEKVAIKHIDRVFADKADTVRIIRELRFLRVLKHPNIIGVVDVLLPQQRTTFVRPRCARGICTSCHSCFRPRRARIPRTPTDAPCAVPRPH
jgi:serine/threonine protein kinase